MSAPPTYSRTQIALHWTIAGLIAVQLVINDAVELAFDARMDGGDGTTALAILHIALGTTILVLAVWRIALRLARGAPPPPPSNPALVIWAGASNHLALYLLLFAMPMSGLAAWFGYSEIAAELHEYGRWLLLVLIALHLLGVAVEHLILGQDTLGRMQAGDPKPPEPAKARNI